MKTKPFNLEQAKAGSPIAAERKGMEPLPARLLASDIDGDHQVVYAFSKESGGEIVGMCDKYGKQHGVATVLVMIPLGQLDGRDVWPGDTLLHNGAAIIVSCKFTMGDSGYSWPTQYPTVQWTPQEAYSKYCQLNIGDPTLAELSKDIANAAIRHGIDNFYLYDAKKFKDQLGALSRAMGQTSWAATTLLDEAANRLKKEIALKEAVTTLKLWVDGERTLSGGLVACMRRIDEALDK